MIRRLVVSHGQRERELALVGTIVVGRDPECDVSEDGDSLLSRRHSEFALGPNGVVVRDLGSRNGTFVNGVKTVESPVKPGDVIQIGHLLVRLVEGDAALPIVTGAADDDATMMMRAPLAPAAAPPSRPAAASTAVDDRTIIIPRQPAGAPAAEDDRTLIVKPPAAGFAPPSATVAMTPPPEWAAVTASTPSPRAQDLHDRPASVAGHVAILSVVVFLAGASATLLGGDAAASPLMRLAPGALVAALATAAAAAVINRRVGRVAAGRDRVSETTRLGAGTQASASAAPEARR